MPYNFHFFVLNFKFNQSVFIFIFILNLKISQKHLSDALIELYHDKKEFLIFFYFFFLTLDKIIINSPIISMSQLCKMRNHEKNQILQEADNRCCYFIMFHNRRGNLLCIHIRSKASCLTEIESHFKQQKKREFYNHRKITFL